jgi:hypothetical protein
MPPPARSELIQRYETCLHINGRLLLEGVCARSGVVTHNNRVYPARPLSRAGRAFQRGAVQRGLALGELDHPSYASSLYRRVSLANASHAVLRLSWRKTRNDGEGELVALIEVLPTPSGLLLFSLAARGVPIAASQRCWAEVEWRRVDDDEQIGFVCGRTLELLAVDVVPDPANAGAWLSPVARRVVVGGGGGFGWGCWPGANLPAIAAVDPSAVSLAHLGTGAVSPALAAEGGLALPTAAAVVERLCAAAEGEGEGAPCVGPLQLSSHYADACLEETPELRSLVAARVEGPDASGKARSRSLPAHWRRFTERALRCEARERERERQVQEEEEDEDRAQTTMGCLPCLPGSQRRVRRRQRGRRRAGQAAAASVAPLRPPLVGDGDGGGEEALATTPIEAEVDAVLWSREDKARDVRRRVLRRWLA